MEEMYIHELCRLCLYKSENLFDIFGVDGRHGYLAAEVIQDLLQIEVGRFDGFPRCVCCNCLDKLTDFKLFKDQCMESRLSFEQVMAFPKKQAPSGGHQDVHQVSLESNVQLGSFHKEQRMRNSKGRFTRGTPAGRAEAREKSARKVELAGEAVDSTVEEISAASIVSRASLTLKELLQGSPSMPRDKGGVSRGDLRKEGISPVETVQVRAENSLPMDGPASSVGRENLRPRTGTPLKRQRTPNSSKDSLEKRPKLMRGCETRSPVVPDITLSRVNVPDSCSTGGQGTDKLKKPASPTVHTVVDSPAALQPKEVHHTSLEDVPGWKQPRRIAASAHMYTEGSILLSSGNVPQGYVDWSCLGSEPPRKKKQRQKAKQSPPPTKANTGLDASAQAPSAQDGVGAVEPKGAFQCSTCGRWFQSQKLYLQHRKTHDTQEPCPNECPLCRKVFATSQTLKRHQFTHSELRPFACNLCDLGYKRIDYLKRHIELHHKAQ
ncbi:uncharacterized protein [Hetaerina americana]|uniref:uncharacterized protein isoform X2 n=1 Tax=Hetaerina americana TaxID=62018 RepID=UPI003A7F11DF